MISPYVHAIYCDDIRYEIDGKTTYVGAYSGVAVLPAYPVSLVRLCVSVWIVIPPEKNTRHVKVRIILGDEELSSGEFDIASENGSGHILPPPGLEIPEGMIFEAMGANPQFFFTPLALKEPGRLRVLVNIDGVEFRAPALLFVKPVRSAEGPI